MSESLSSLLQWGIKALAFILVAFGQPAWFPSLGLFASSIGYALLLATLLHRSGKYRFWMATLWFCGVQLVQLSWFISHPYWYIYSVYFLLSFAMGLQFGVIGWLIQAKYLGNLLTLLAISGLWTLFEWSRLFVLSGFSWNPIGLALSGSPYALQMASLFGVYGLSFWTLLVNLIALHAWQKKDAFFRPGAHCLWISAACLPYLYGHFHLVFFQGEKEAEITAVLVQTAVAPEEIGDRGNPAGQAFAEWVNILHIMQKHQGKKIDLILLPECVVPFGAFSFIYPAQQAMQAFKEVFGAESLERLPPLELPYALYAEDTLLVANAFWAQAIANLFSADVLAGLEDAENVSLSQRQYYSAALLFRPPSTENVTANFQRYEKRILVPMGEYIPFSFCQKIAACYGVFSSFTQGKEAKVMVCNKIPFSPSICYEETFGNLIREGRQQGAKLLVNLTNDAWYPNSRLMRQHYDHARLRTVENGVPLIRACNTGITAALDSFGRPIAILGGSRASAFEWIADSLLVNVPIHTYPTLYTTVGDRLIVALSFLSLLAFCNKKRF